MKHRQLSYHAWAVVLLFFIGVIGSLLTFNVVYPYGQATCADLAVTIGETIVHEANLSRSREAKLKHTFRELSDGIRSGRIPLWQAISILIEFQRHHIFIAVHTATLAQTTLQYAPVTDDKIEHLNQAYRRVLYGILHQKISSSKLEPLEYQLTRFASAQDGGLRREEALQRKQYTGHIEQITTICTELADDADIPAYPPAPDWQLAIENAIREGSAVEGPFGLLQKLLTLETEDT